MKDSNVFEVAVKDGVATLARYLGAAQDVQIPEMLNGMPVVGVAERAFAGTHANTLVFPDGLRRLHMNALEGCNQVMEVSLPGSIEEIAGSLQDSCPELKTLVLRGAALSPASMRAVSCLNGVQVLHHYRNDGIEAWVNLEMRAICGW